MENISGTFLQCPMCNGLFSSSEDFKDHVSQHEKNGDNCEVTEMKTVQMELVDINDIDVACDVEISAEEDNPDLLSSSIVKSEIESVEGGTDDDLQLELASDSDISDSLVSLDEDSDSHYELEKTRPLNVKVAPVETLTKFEKSSELLKHIQSDHLSNIRDNRNKSVVRTQHVQSERPLKTKDINLSLNDSVCNLCRVSFPDLKALQKHVCEYVEKSKPYNIRSRRSSSQILKVKFNKKTQLQITWCDICGKKFRNLKNLKQHEKTHSKKKEMASRKVKSKEIFTCGTCGEKFSSETQYDIHLISHDSVTEEKQYVCKKCNKSFANIRYLQKHELRHVEVKLFDCEKCGKSFGVKSDLQTHLKTHDESLKLIRKSKITDAPCCEECGKSFSSRSNLKKHYAIHSDIRQFVCHECPKSYKAKGELTRHIQSAHNGLKYTCSKCPRKFASAYYVKLHERSHSRNGLLYCEVCNKEFFVQAAYLRHKMSHTGEKPFVCSICGKGMKSNASLQNHIKIHQGKKPYQCDSCDKSFISKLHLKDHKTTHVGVKIHKCRHCRKSFHHQRSLARHLKKKHGGKVGTADRSYSDELSEQSEVDESEEDSSESD